MYNYDMGAFGYTTCRKEGYTNLLNYNARFYSPRLGRFISADSVVPNPLDPLSFDRFSYVRANPIKFSDPTGHAYYDPGCECMVYEPHLPPTPTPPARQPVLPWEQEDIEPEAWMRQNGEAWMRQNGWLTPPDFSNIRDPELRGIEKFQQVWDNYIKIRNELFINYGYQYVDEAGKIRDEALIALILGSEVSSYRDEPAGSLKNQAYWEVVEAVSNQYRSTSTTHPIANIYCGGNCTLEEQLAWLTDIQGFYDGAAKAEYVTLLAADAELVMGGFCYGAHCDAWMWGNVDATERASYGAIIIEVVTHWDDDHNPDKWFIVH